MNKMNELIAVVQRATLFSDDSDWRGVRAVDEKQFDAVSFVEAMEYMPRGIAEKTYTHKQIIPYFVFLYEDKLFLMQRSSKSSESRLSSCYTLGIGGHLRKEDVEGKPLSEWGMREFHEEVWYTDPYTISFVGVVNDDFTDVGRVHSGYFFLVHGSSDAIRVRSELKQGRLVTFKECEQFFDSMETWSQLVFEYLKKEKK